MKQHFQKKLKVIVSKIIHFSYVLAYSIVYACKRLKRYWNLTKKITSKNLIQGGQYYDD